ncbi:ABC transporter substrate-binding protein [Rhizobium leguminosarum]|uniref:ABC transporter substrate-binding protein n=1 Tax=Rhizobium leguminosarum TaxID=384 RepID=UPI001C913AB3|nr:ABC transporter substrate-binding protein [Rhizobium leguminosarum]MBY2967507.1 ABC transporter substrate-binding protein [Rhizobium leguminosarum]
MYISHHIATTALVAACLTFGSVGAAALAADTKVVATAQLDDFKDWDPAIAFSIEVNFLQSVYETLTHYNMPGSKEMLSPRLAVSWTHNPESTVWTFKMRKGAKFHDGTPVTAAAAKASIERTIKLKQGASYIWDGISSIEAPDDETLIFNCSRPMAVATIASAQFGAYIYSPTAAEKGTDWFNAGNDGGSGPFQVESHQKDTQTVLKKFPGYWGKTVEGGFATAILKVVKEASTQLQLLKSGEVDFIDSLSPDSIATVQENPDLAIDLAPSYKNIHMLLNVKKAPTDNLNFRKALAYAMDYGSAVDGVYSGAGSITSGPLPSTQWGHADGLNAPTFDLDQAKKYLEDSGIPADQRKVTLTYPATDEGNKNAALLLQSNAAMIGIDVELKPGPWGTIWERQKNLETSENIFEVVLWPTYLTPSDILISIYRTEDPTFFNLGHYDNPAYNQVLNEAVALEASRPEQALTKYAEAEKILVEDVSSIGVIDLKNWMPHRKSLVGYTFNPAYNGFDFGNYRRAD